MSKQQALPESFVITICAFKDSSVCSRLYEDADANDQDIGVLLKMCGKGRADGARRSLRLVLASHAEGIVARGELRVYNRSYQEACQEG